MSDWNTRKAPSVATVTKAGQHNAGFFEATKNESTETAEDYESQRKAEEAGAAAKKVSAAFGESFALCERLQRQQVFKNGDKETPLKEGVIDAMGDSAAELLNLKQSAPEHSAGPSLGMSSSSGYEPES